MYVHSRIMKPKVTRTAVSKSTEKYKIIVGTKKVVANIFCICNFLEMAYTHTSGK